MDALIAIGRGAPDFELPDLKGDLHRLEDFRGKVVVINFWSGECPHSARTDRELASLIKGWGDAVVLLTVASNANEPIELLRSAAAERGLGPVLHDAKHQVADLYGAATTPHLFVVDAQGILRYRGAFDDMTFRRRIPTQFYLRQAVEAVLEGRLPDPAETEPYGCTIVRYAV
jgi:peroxiredoxin